MDLVYLIKKQNNITTYDIIRDLKKKINIKGLKIGHTGTLDPFASGLVIVLLGKATKLSDLFLNLDKKYSGIFLTKIKTDTKDITGKIIEKNEIDINLENNKSYLKNYKYKQIPPNYSAKKVGGLPSYKMSRENICFSLLPQEVFIKDFKVKKIKNNTYEFFSHVSKGTYIRALVEDFAKYNNNALATCKTLQRDQIGPFKLEDITKDNKKQFSITDVLDKLNIVKHYITSEEKVKVLNGVHIKLNLNDEYIQVYLKDEFLALYRKCAQNDYKPQLII